ncbi:pyruvate decarboxylase [Hyphopichia burtonii NRRL Y-1933]|uniref:Pyruvate decarboxylase n=1 Tax=Hyphopichia burtonii NRRL Y-1933 TaxID=984485 RepID=A0A1E4RJF8_9ASCO|nr:pyruvate decarboxylase [Hyphopichia burtonii NRRL Y-1933]ODV67414.1 pyruvate decarboxylase [Hyphopichia burtonii NRRL Y-1933]
MPQETITLGRYLFERLVQKPLDINTIFGVPGDFNLTLLDKIYEVENLKWAGNVNELNAAYAADGYSRVKHSLSCLVTTFGVGELSAFNGLAGSYAEHVGVLSVVGIPSIDSQQKQLLLHHTLGNGDFTVFERMTSNITQTTIVLKDAHNAPDEIDRAIREAYINQRPVYLGFPSNMVSVEVPADRLKTPLDLSLPKNDEDAQNEVVERVLELISKAKDPVILIDACCGRHDSTKEARRLIDTTNFKFAVTPLAKGSTNIDESHERFTGIYVGSLSYPEVKSAVESSDLVLSLGALLSDFNTGSFSYSLQSNVVEFHSDYTKIRNANYPNVRMKEVLNKILESPNLKQSISHFKPSSITKDPFPEVKQDPESKISQQWLWTRLSKWLKPGDTVITETGTSSFGIIQTRFPENVFGISQVLWGSIGYSVGATYGAVAAAEELNPEKRTILFVGDGSLQLTAQELSAMIRAENKPYIFVLNNKGFTIEKLIHGPKAHYNQIQPWDHAKFIESFNPKNAETHSVHKVKDLENLFNDAKFAKSDKFRLIEINLEEMDAPINLIEQAKLSEKANAQN